MISDRVATAALFLGILSLAAAGTLWLTRPPHLPPQIIVQPAPVQVQTIPAPVVQNSISVPKDQGQVHAEPVPVPKPKPADIFATEDGRKVVRIEAEMSRDKPKKKAKKKRKPSSVDKLKRDWSRAETSFPFIFKGFD